MPATHRLTGRELRAARPRKRIQGALFSLSVLPLPGRVARGTIVVSKSVAVRAVDRNLIKRRARAALLPHLRTLPPAGYVLTAKKAASSASARAIGEDIAALLRSGASR